jgi:hypothetical protein
MLSYTALADAEFRLLSMFLLLLGFLLLLPLALLALQQLLMVRCFKTAFCPWYDKGKSKCVAEDMKGALQPPQQQQKKVEAEKAYLHGVQSDQGVVLLSGLHSGFAKLQLPMKQHKMETEGVFQSHHPQQQQLLSTTAAASGMIGSCKGDTAPAGACVDHPGAIGANQLVKAEAPTLAAEVPPAAVPALSPAAAPATAQVECSVMATAAAATPSAASAATAADEPEQHSRGRSDLSLLRTEVHQQRVLQRVMPELPPGTSRSITSTLGAAAVVRAVRLPPSAHWRAPPQPHRLPQKDCHTHLQQQHQAFLADPPQQVACLHLSKATTAGGRVQAAVAGKALGGAAARESAPQRIRCSSEQQQQQWWRKLPGGAAMAASAAGSGSNCSALYRTNTQTITISMKFRITHKPATTSPTIADGDDGDDGVVKLQPLSSHVSYAGPGYIPGTSATPSAGAVFCHVPSIAISTTPVGVHSKSILLEILQ